MGKTSPQIRINKGSGTDPIDANNTRLSFQQLLCTIKNRKICLLRILSRCEFRSLQSPYQLCKILKGCSDLNMATKILQGGPPLLEVCTDTLPEYDNWNVARGYLAEIRLPLWKTKFSISPNHSITSFLSSSSEDYH